MLQQVMKIRDVSQQYGVSTRTLRYYEQIGLLPSVRSEEYAYRMYDAAAVHRLRQILVLRKLQVPISDISRILNQPDARQALDVFFRQLDQLDGQIHAMQELRRVIDALITQLKRVEDVRSLEMESLYGQALLQLQSADYRQDQQEELPTMEELDQSAQIVSAIQEVRIVKLPPMRFAAYRAISASPEQECWDIILPWYQRNQLAQAANVRVFGHNNPDPDGTNPEYGYEIMVSVSPEMQLEAPLYEINFPGGLYAAHVCTLANIGEVWHELIKWTRESKQYEPDFSGWYSHHPGLEETLDMDAVTLGNEMQLDILVPISRL